MPSDRVPVDLAPNRLAAARAAADVRFDLTVSNPTRVGIPYPSDLLAPLADPAGLAYAPDPRGLRSARQAVAAEYGRLGLAPDPDRIVLTASTSEAYAFLFKLLCAPGEAVLVPTPSYPLFEHLAGVEAVRALPYQLEPDSAWRIDLDELAQAPRDARAVIVVHPNNPTGSFVHPDDAAALGELCAERGWALVADEVFLDYPLAGGAGAGRSFAAEERCLTFTLGGLSKSVGLPQLKLAWAVVSGPEAAVRPALDRLEFIADTFLSVATPVQLALPHLLARGTPVREAILARCRGNLASAREALATMPGLALLPAGGGWSAVLRYPAIVGEEDLALELLAEGVAVQPGFFFDFPLEGILVLSLLPQPDVFDEGLAAVLVQIASHLARY